MSDNARRMAKLREMAAAELTPDTDPLAPNEVVISPSRDMTISSPRDMTISRGVQRPSSGRLLVSLSNTEREVLELAADLAPGDSGSALVAPDGTVIGVAFAIAPDRPGVAYALTVDELEAVLAGDLSSAVSTGPCI